MGRAVVVAVGMRARRGGRGIGRIGRGGRGRGWIRLWGVVWRWRVTKGVSCGKAGSMDSILESSGKGEEEREGGMEGAGITKKVEVVITRR